MKDLIKYMGIVKKEAGADKENCDKIIAVLKSVASADPHHIVMVVGKDQQGANPFWDVVIKCHISRNLKRISYNIKKEEAILYAKDFAKRNNLYYEETEMQEDNTPQRTSARRRSAHYPPSLVDTISMEEDISPGEIRDNESF